MGNLDEYAELFFNRSIDELDPRLAELIHFEEERQARKIILIPSESLTPAPVRAALGSVFTSLYAEGYPPLEMIRAPEELLTDFAYQLSYYRRYSDRRFYKGVEYVDILEALAQRRVAECFVNPRAKVEEIHVNVQPLSGAAANLAVYDAFVEPGDVVMGMDLMHGGHLTHGSRFNFSGKRYHVVSYAVDPQTERLDYDRIMELAKQHKPKLIIAGYTSYPWAPDWERFREIADAVGAILLADIAHTAGMVIGGVYPNPVGIADVVTFTTHKTVLGPRGACILTTDEEKAQKIDSAVFPGEQGGPHVNKFAAMAVAFHIAQTEAFKELQHRIVENAQALAAALQEQGLRLAYGGTNTHIVMVDLKSIRSGTGNTNRVLYGEPAARILDLAGIVVNKNTIPGDTITALATGIRLGTPWVSQRGMGPQEMARIAELIQRMLTNIKPFSYHGLRSELPRGKIGLDVLETVKRDVAELVNATKAEIGPRGLGYPHYYSVYDEPAHGSRLPEEFQGQLLGPDAGIRAAREAAALLDQTEMSVLQIRGERAEPFLQETLTADIAALEPGQCGYSLILNKNSAVLDDLLVLRLEPDRWGRDRFIILAHAPNAPRVKTWLRALSDGYIEFDDHDVYKKIEGPVVVEDLNTAEVPAAERRTAVALHGEHAPEILEKVAASVPGEGQVVTALCNGSVEALIARCHYHDGVPRFTLLMDPDDLESLWQMLVSAGAVPVNAEARRALRERAGLPEPDYTTERSQARELHERHHALFKITKPYFIGQAALVAAAPSTGEEEKELFTWEEREPAELRRTALYEEHRKLGAKMVAFAGWEMPVWYTSIAEEHRAVREAAALFDVGHMGVLEVAGRHAASFLDALTTNYVRWIGDGQSQYTYFIDPDGRVIDDLIIYRRRVDDYILVVNAANAEKDLAWLRGVNEGRFILDRARPWIESPGPVTVRDLKDQEVGPEMRVDLALQGPRALDILLSLTDDPVIQNRLRRLKRTEFVELELAGFPLLIARTGYTGEEIGYEILVHPEQAVALWRLLLDAGREYGLKPAGLGARDSTRTEAGLPLYGHELAGELNISPLEAGFGGYVKFHKPFFVGREPLLEGFESLRREVIRFRMGKRGIRPPRYGDPVVDRHGRYLGAVTSCAPDATGVLVGMAVVERGSAKQGDRIAIFALPERRLAEKPKWELSRGDRVLLPVEAEVVPRFAVRRAPGLRAACSE